MVDKQDLTNKAENIWTRARHNAFAHKVALKRISTRLKCIYSAQILFLIVPIAATGISLQQYSFQKPNQTLNLDLLIMLGIITIFSNALALGLGILVEKLQLERNCNIHKTNLSGYQLIAQKVRSIDDSILPIEDQAAIIRVIEDFFVIFKGMGDEPSDADFDKAQKMLEKTLGRPFE